MKKSTIAILSSLVGAGVGAVAMGKPLSNKLKDVQKLSDKHLALYLMMNQWVKVKQDGKSLSSYFERENFHQIAIYGMSYAGETLVEELQGSNVEIKFGIDKKAVSIYADFDVLSPDDELNEVDAIVVTSITFFDEIREMLSKKVTCPILSLEDILYEV